MQPYPYRSIGGGPLARSVAAVLLCVCASVAPASVGAQVGSLPTLSDVWDGYSSPGGTVQLAVLGRLDLEGYLPGSDPAWLIPSTEPFATGRLRVFTDLFVGGSWMASGELRADGGEAPEAGRVEARVEQVWVRWAPRPALAVQVGKFVSPFGSYPNRHHTAADPLIRPPLHYEYRTMVLGGEAPFNSAAFVAWKDDPDRFRPEGAPPIWGAPYQWGAMAFGSLGDASYRLAVLNSAPSSEPEAWAWSTERLLERPSFVVALGYRFTPGLRAEFWYDRGPYMKDAGEVRGLFPGGSTSGDYDQILLGGEVVVQRGHTTVRAEGVHDRWEVPNVPDDPIDISYSLEAQQTLGTGLFVAGRLGTIRFNEITAGGDAYEGGASGLEIWDYPVYRLQLGGGYRLARNAEVRAEYAWNRSEAPVDPDDDLLSIQLWWAF